MPLTMGKSVVSRPWMRAIETPDEAMPVYETAPSVPMARAGKAVNGRAALVAGQLVMNWAAAVYAMPGVMAVSSGPDQAGPLLTGAWIQAWWRDSVTRIEPAMAR